MDYPERKPKEKPKRGEASAQIEFAAPYSLADCLYRLRDTKHLGSGLFGPGIDPSFEKIDDITYRIQVRRTWYDYRYRKHYAYVEVRGYLRALDSGTTMVIATVRIAPSAYLLMGLFTLLLAMVILLPATRGMNPVTTLPFVGIVGFFAAMLYFDRRTLLYLLRTTLAGDV